MQINDKNDKKSIARFAKKYAKERKMLTNAYKKRIMDVVEGDFQLEAANFDVFYVYMQFLYDKLTLELGLNKAINEEKAKKAMHSLASASDAYEEYYACYFKYFEEGDHEVKSKIGESLDKTYAKYKEESKKYLADFLDIVKENIFEWDLQSF